MSAKDRLLECLSSGEELTLFQIADHLKRPKREIVNLLVGLQKEGKVIRRRSHPKDRLHSYSRVSQP